METDPCNAHASELTVKGAMLSTPNCAADEKWHLRNRAGVLATNLAARAQFLAIRSGRSAELDQAPQCSKAALWALVKRRVCYVKQKVKAATIVSGQSRTNGFTPNVLACRGWVRKPDRNQRLGISSIA